jgi:hypothetical protein
MAAGVLVGLAAGREDGTAVAVALAVRVGVAVAGGVGVAVAVAVSVGIGLAVDVAGASVGGTAVGGISVGGTSVGGTSVGGTTVGDVAVGGAAAGVSVGAGNADASLLALAGWVGSAAVGGWPPSVCAVALLSPRTGVSTGFSTMATLLPMRSSTHSSGPPAMGLIKSRASRRITPPGKPNVSRRDGAVVNVRPQWGQIV